MENNIKSLIKDGKDIIPFDDMQKLGIDKIYLYTRYPLLNANDMGVVIADNAEDALHKLEEQVPSSGLDGLSFNVFSIFNALNKFGYKPENRHDKRLKLFSWRYTACHLEYAGLVYATDPDDAAHKVETNEELLNDKDLQFALKNFHGDLTIELVDLTKEFSIVSAFAE